MLTTTTKVPVLDDTIVALSSAMGPGARAIVRLSGRLAGAVARAICPEFDAPGGRFHLGAIRLSNFHAPVPADLYFFRAPHTYTGQDVVEIHTISCQPIVEQVIADCLNSGARAAQPGEFTMRAFLAGKLDLTRAEAVLGVIEATDRGQLTQALTQLAGGLAGPLRELRDDLLNLLADVEAGLDFAEEGIKFVFSDEILKRLGNGLAHLTLMRRQLDQRTLSQRAFRVVLAGKPNAGKSSLFNALVGTDAALVSPTPGTTRDYLEKVLEIDGVKLELVDTAGLLESQQRIELSAQELARSQANAADLTLWCIACDDPEASDVQTPGWRIATKADLASPPAGLLATSARTGVGMDELRKRLADHVRRASHASLAPSLSRCRHHVEACLQNLRRAHALVIDEDLPELLALELRLALDELGAVVGAVCTDDLLDRVFSRFCIGK